MFKYPAELYGRKRAWFERICLWFVRPQYERIGIIVVKIKKMWGHTYVMDYFMAPPKHFNCRCSINPQDKISKAPDN